MKKSKKHHRNLLVNLLLTTLVALSPSKVWAQTLSCFDNLIFGQIVTCGGAGTVTVRPDNSQVETCVTVNPPTSRARCIVTQSFPFRPIQISINAPTYVINNGGAGNMNVNAFNIITNANGPTSTITAPFVSVPIGATLSVGGTQATGTYTGTFGITAILQ